MRTCARRAHVRMFRERIVKQVNTPVKIARHRRERKHYSRMTRKEMKTAYLMLLPGFALLSLFVLYPLFTAAYRSLYDWTFYVEATYIGLENYKTILQSSIFRQTIGNALRFVVFQVPLGILIPFLYAVLLKTLNERMSGFIKCAVYIPGILSGAVASIMVLALFNYRGGWFNQIVMGLGFKRIAMTKSVFWSYFAIIGTNVWMGLGGGAILNYAGLAGIPQTYYEAASLDGASGLQRLWYITVPQMKNLFILQIINGTSGTLQMFDMPNFITAGGPVNSTTTPVLYLYMLYRDTTKTMGYTISAAMILMVIIAVINAFVFRIIRSEKTIEG